MGTIPANLTRVPTFLASQVSLRGITSNNTDLARLQQQLTTGLRLNSFSDDPIAGSLVSVLDTELETAAQRQRNLDHASSVFNAIDSELGTISSLILDAKEIASSQVGIGSDSATRLQQAALVTSLIDELVLAANSDYAGISLFAGGRTGETPIRFENGGYRYLGDTDGLRTDLGPGLDFPITLPADAAIGALSERVEGDVDLNPRLTAGTRISDLRGPLETDELGSVTITIDVAGTPTDVVVDLSDARTIEDVTTRLEAEIRAAAPGALAGTFPGGVTFTGDRLQINANATVSITFDSTTPTPGVASRALGLAGFTYDNANATNPAPDASLNPRLTNDTRLGDLDPAVALAFGDITFNNAGRTATVPTDPTMTIGALMNAVEGLDLGLRLEINPDGDRIDVVNEISGVSASIAEGGTQAATTLGIRSFSGSTALSVFNDGRGVEIADGAVDPDTGLPDPARNVDFAITLSDGTSFEVDLTPDDATDVRSVLDAINAAAASATPPIPVGAGPGQFRATLSNGANGIQLEDRLGGTDAVRVESINGFAAEDLGLLSGESTTGNPALLLGEDRAEVRVNSLITTLMDLRRALETDDSRGITFAGERLEDEVDRVVSARALAGGRAQRVEATSLRLEDRVVLDRQVKSDLQDLDFIEASTRFTQLQTQLQASLTATAQVSQLTLLNFL